MSQTSPSARAVKRAHTLIELMMKEMYANLRDPHRLTPEQWDKLFGAKQSMIGNLHKLVAALIALPKGEEIQQAADDDTPINAQELEMLSAWLAEKGD